MKDMFHVIAVNLYGQQLSSATFPLPYSSTDDYYEKVAGKIQEFILEHRYKPDQILASPSQPGHNFPGRRLRHLRSNHGQFGTWYSRFCLAPALTVPSCHDSKAAAYLELWNRPTLDSAVVFLLNHNLGGAVITGHAVHPGSSMHSGTLEHICIDPKGPLCYCGSRGCPGDLLLCKRS